MTTSSTSTGNKINLLDQVNYPADLKKFNLKEIKNIKRTYFKKQSQML